MIVLRKNDIPRVVGDNSGRDKAEREDMDARRRQKRSKREWLKEGEEETDSKPSWNFLFGIWHCTAYLPLDTSYLCGNRVSYTCITTTKQTLQTYLFWFRAAKAVTARSQIFIADFIKSSL